MRAPLLILTALDLKNEPAYVLWVWFGVLLEARPQREPFVLPHLWRAGAWTACSRFVGRKATRSHILKRFSIQSMSNVGLSRLRNTGEPHIAFPIDGAVLDLANLDSQSSRISVQE